MGNWTQESGVAVLTPPSLGTASCDPGSVGLTDWGRGGNYLPLPPTGCSLQDQESGEIIGGQETRPHTRPYMAIVSIEVRRNWVPDLGGRVGDSSSL